MKRTAVIPALLLIFTLCASLISCSGDGTTSFLRDDGEWQIAEEGDGFTFYAPADWDVSAAGGVTMANVSAVDPSNMTVVRVKSDLTPADYFTANESELAAKLPSYALLADECSDDAVFGGKSAICRVYTATLAGTPYKFMQLLTADAGYIYLLTYTAQNVVPSGDFTYFDRYLETVMDAAEIFAFTGKAAEAAVEVAREKNEAGLTLASDPAVSRYALWVPDVFLPDLSTGITTVATADKKAVVTVSSCQPEAESIDAFWKERRAVYASIYGDFATEAEQGEDRQAYYRFGGQAAARYLYTFTESGVSYRTLELLTVRGVYVYIVTYTAALDVYDVYYPAFETILTNFTFD